MCIPMPSRAYRLYGLLAFFAVLSSGCLGLGSSTDDLSLPLIEIGRLSLAKRSDARREYLKAMDSGWRSWPRSPPGGGLAEAGDPDSVLTWVSRIEPVPLAQPNLVVGMMPHPVKIWVNGVLVHSWSDPDGPNSKVDFRSHAIALGPALWARESVNTVVMQIRPVGGAGRLPNLSLAEGSRASRRVWLNDMLNFVFPTMVFGTGIFLSALFLVLFFQLGRERMARVWFWLTSALFSISFLDMVFCAEDMPALAIWKISRLSLCLAAMAIAHFQIVQSGWSRLSRRILPWSTTLGIALTFWLLSAQDHATLESRFHLCTEIVLGPLLVANLALATRNLLIRRRIAETWTFLGLLVYAIGGTHDLVVYITGVLPDTWWYPAGFLFLDYCLALTVSQDLVLAWRQNRQRAADLEFALHGQHEAKARAESAVRARNRFLEQMAHRFRTPLQGLSGALDLGPGDLGPEVRAELGHQLRTHLAQINEVIDRIDLEAGRIEIKPIVFALADLVESWNRSAASSGHGQATFSLHSRVRLRADRERIERIVRIVHAAVCPEGNADSSRVEVHVGTDGLVAAFHASRSLQEAHDQAGEGSDLAAVLDLLVPLGAVLGGNGEHEVSITFPVEVLPAEEPSHFDEDSRPLVVLAEDDRVNARILGSLLDRAGCRVVHALDGEKALLEIAKVRPHLVLMDVMMPVMDGLEATRRIRADDAIRGIPVIGVTAHGNSAECLAAGMDEMLAKPIRAEQIRDVVQRYCVPRD